MVNCCVVNCENSESTSKLINFIKDRNLDRLNRWKRLIGLDENENVKKKKICIHHFKEEDFQNRSNRFELKANVEP